MAENKTKPTVLSVAAFVEAIPDHTKRDDANTLIQMMQAATGQPPKMWGPAIIGFGTRHYSYESGREGDMPLISFAPRKAGLTLYSLLASETAPDLLAKLGEHTTGKGCLYIKKLTDIDPYILITLITNAVRNHVSDTMPSE